MKQLGPYQIERKLGEGGMGAVFLGRDQANQRQVAIKLLPHTMAKRPGFRVRFHSEIQSLRKLEHPNIVQLFGFGEQDGQLFYAMEYIAGNSLQDELEQGRRFTWEEVIDLGVPLCKALRHAHLHGIIHRDIKPANIMLNPTGEPKLTDFGIARLYGHEKLTLAGGPIGTASYMAPEQALGETKITEQADLYAMGGTFYALLSGHPPFEADSLLRLIEMQKHQPPQPIHLLVPQVPQELSRVITTLLSKDPHDRLANANILAKSLQGVRQAVTLRQQSHTPRNVPDPGPPAAPNRPPLPPTPSPGDADQTLLSPTQAAIAQAQQQNPPTPPPPSPSQAPTQLLDKSADATPSPPRHATTLKLEDAPAQNRHDNDREDPDRTVISTAAQRPTLPETSGDDAVRNHPSHKTATFVSGQDSEQETQMPPLLPPHSVYVTAEEARRQDQLRQREEERRRPHIISIGTLILMAVLIVITIGAWLWHSPPTPDQLMAKIHALADRNDTYSMEKTFQLIRRFEQFADPKDPRRREIARIREDLQIRTLEKKLRRQAKYKMANEKALTLIERICLEAISQIQSHPEQARAQLQALLVLHADPQITITRREQRLLDVAKRLVEQLRKNLQVYKTTHLATLNKQLTRARYFLKINPARTLAVCKAILTLYEEKPWADSITRQARILRQQAQQAVHAQQAQQVFHTQQTSPDQIPSTHPSPATQGSSP